MAETQVQVLEVHDAHLKVMGQRTGGCKACAQRDHCGVQGSELNHKKIFVMDVPYHSGDVGAVQPGDLLTLGCDEKQLFRAILVLFGLPLFGLILAPLLWMLCCSGTASDLSVLITAAFGTLAGLWISRKVAAKVTRSEAVSAATISLVTNPTKPV